MSGRESEFPKTRTIGRDLASISKRIGRYKLLQRIGVGGMGEVWMAEQTTPIKRNVALKMIKTGLDSNQVLARFEAERQALAMMDHLNIAKILDAGTTESGAPYFVMELVQGIPINEYCDREKLALRERLELFVPVCNAIQHAHQKGIIHRDLKPTNVLIQTYDGKPNAKVIDFGVAKALQHQSMLTDKTLFTEFGQIIGTVQYMSPEQATLDALNVDTRTDIYSLGIMLYELLSGTTPIEKETIQKNALLQVLSLIRECEPPSPSQRISSSNESIRTVSELRRVQPTKLQSILNGELDWIAMKAIEKDRSRRYENASGLADDINRYLDGRAILARPTSAFYKFQKLLTQNKQFLASLAIILAVLFVATVVSTWSIQKWQVSSQNAANALDAKNKSEIERERAQAAEYDAQVSAAKVAFFRGINLCQAGEPDVGLIWLTQALKLLPSGNENEPKIRQCVSIWERSAHTTTEIPMLSRLSTISGLLAPVTGNLAEYNHQFSSGVGAITYGFRIADSLPVDINIDGTLVAESDVNGEVGIWNPLVLKRGARLKAGIDTSVKGAIKISKSGRYVFTANRRTVSLTDLTTHERIEVGLQDGWPVTCADYVDEKTALVSTVNDEMFLVDFDKKSVTKLNQQNFEIREIRKSATSGFIFAFGESEVEIASSENKVRFQYPDRNSKFSTAAISPEGNYFAIGYSSGLLDIYRVGGGVKLVGSFNDHQAAISSICFSSDARLLASGDESGSVKLLDLKQMLRTGQSLEHEMPISKLKFSANTNQLHVCFFNSYAWIRSWNVGDINHNEHILREHESYEGLSAVSLEFVGENLLCIVNDTDFFGPIGQMEVWNHESPSKPRLGLSRDLSLARKIPNFNQFVTVSRKNQLELIELEMGIRRGKSFTPEFPVRAIAVHPNGETIAAVGGEWPYESSSGYLILWSTKSQTVQSKIKLDRGAIDVAFDATGDQVAVATESGIEIWSTDSSSKIWVFDVSTPFTINWKGDRIIVGCDDGTICVLDSKRQKLIQTLNGHEGIVRSTILLQTSNVLITAAVDGTVRMWDLDSGIQLGVLRQYESEVTAMCISNDMSTLAISTDDGKTMLLEIPKATTEKPNELQKRLESKLGLQFLETGIIRK